MAMKGKIERGDKEYMNKMVNSDRECMRSKRVKAFATDDEQSIMIEEHTVVKK